MKNANALSRRRFLQTGLVSGVLVSTIPASLFAAVTKAEQEPFHGLKVGMASYTLRRFSLDQVIAMTTQARLKYLNLKDVHLPLTSTPEECAAAARKIKEAGLVLMGGGVIYLK